MDKKIMSKRDGSFWTLFEHYSKKSKKLRMRRIK